MHERRGKRKRGGRAIEAQSTFSYVITVAQSVGTWESWVHGGSPRGPPESPIKVCTLHRLVCV